MYVFHWFPKFDSDCSWLVFFTGIPFFWQSGCQAVPVGERRPSRDRIPTPFVKEMGPWTSCDCWLGRRWKCDSFDALRSQWETAGFFLEFMRNPSDSFDMMTMMVPKPTRRTWLMTARFNLATRWPLSEPEGIPETLVPWTGLFLRHRDTMRINNTEIIQRSVDSSCSQCEHSSHRKVGSSPFHASPLAGATWACLSLRGISSMKA